MTFMKTKSPLLSFSIVVILLFVTCEKEEEITGPIEPGSTPTKAIVTMDKSIILSAGRDSSLWNVQLVQITDNDTDSFSSDYTVNMLTDEHGYFLDEGKKDKMITLQTDSEGKASVYFYGSREPGSATTFVWGEGFGLDTVTVSVIVGYPYYVLLNFFDPEEGTWKDLDTLSSGRHSTQPDSTLVRAIVLDIDKNPLKGITVDLSNGEPPIGGGLAGYFKTGPAPTAESHSYPVTNTVGEAMDIYYSDLFPAGGDPITLDIVAVVDSASFGRILTQKSITIVPP